MIHESVVPQQKQRDVHIITQVPKVDFFVGREDELQQIKKLLTQNGKVCLHGMGGIGKTVLAKELCNRVYEEKIHHLADQMISIDLDDGVKHNYAIFQDVLAKIK